MASGTKDEVGDKNNPFWDKDAKKPTRFTIFLFVILTVSMILWGIIDTLNEFHDIEVAFDCDENYYGNVVYGGEIESIDSGSGPRSFTYEISHGSYVRITIWRTANDISAHPLILNLCEDGTLVESITIYDQERETTMDYNV